MSKKKRRMSKGKVVEHEATILYKLNQQPSTPQIIDDIALQLWKLATEDEKRSPL